ncbi:MAG: HIT domain-containing protein, partial [Bdellovibrionales bacterium]|nr:HIT domain-containing protein [Bdellovibrionales bacterium]
PQAPTHVLVIPKEPISQLSEVKPEHSEILGELLLAVAEIARKLNLDSDGYRVVINNGERAGQTVFHLHLHLLAGRELGWPPG